LATAVSGGTAVSALRALVTADLPAVINGTSLSMINSAGDAIDATSNGIALKASNTSSNPLYAAIVAANSAGAGSMALLVSAGGAQFSGTGVQVGSPTGGDKGAGTVNVAGAVYANGVALTAKYPFIFGDGVTTTFTLTHNINSLFYSFDAWYAATGVEPDCDVTHGLNAVTVIFQTAPTLNQMNGVVIG
jgi:hypothetical protein